LIWIKDFREAYICLFTGWGYYDDTQQGLINIRVVQDLKEGEVFSEVNVRSILPGYAEHTRHLDDVLGGQAVKDIDRCTPLHWDLVA